MLASALVLGLASPASGQPDGAERRGTAPHVPGKTVLRIRLEPGDRLVAGTTGVDGARVRGDTVLRLRDARGAAVAVNDDADFTLGSRIVHDVDLDAPPATYALEADCYAGTSCGGVVAWEVSRTPPPPPPTPVRMAVTASAMVAADGRGGALLADALLEWRPVPEVALRLAGTPMGLGGGRGGGVAGGAVHLTLGYEIEGGVELALGGGAAVLGSRLRDTAAQEAGIVVARARFGSRFDFHLEGQVTVGVVNDAAEWVSASGIMQIPLSGSDLRIRVLGGHHGVVLGEAALIVWLTRAGSRGELGLRVSAGVGGVFYQPLCRFGTACGQSNVYAGPMIGLGVEWRPGLRGPRTP
ncbi:MAG TPA: hypothetical protein RMH99_30810 [Sandaracinaceae bacterium LLY-WYZ-13_1]|nr:hypothetical protein [Sandaracinaceae bacterium LLY-WYZ-13_1]